MLEDAFLANILESPDDDLPRLAYADCLMERGDDASCARGELIQVQCQIARRASGTPGDWAAPLASLKAREKAVLDAHGDRWSSAVRQHCVGCEFRRGFIELVALACDNFLWHAGELFRLAPIQRVRFLSAPTQELAASPFLARLTEIGFPRVYIGDAGLSLLLSSPHLTRLTALDLPSCRISNGGVRALAESPVLAQLTSLNLSGNFFNMDGLRLLYGSPHWGGLNQLALSGNPYLDAQTVQFLAESLKGSPDPKVLRSLLQMSSREEREYSSPEVRELGRRADSSDEPARVLGEGLRASHRKLRSAAAQMLAQLGPEALPSVPLLVQRLFESNRLVRDHAAPALGRLLPTLPKEAQQWLCLLANPQLPPLANLRTALSATSLPPKVREELAAICARRIAWRRHIADGQSGPAPAPDLATVDVSSRSVLRMVGTLAVMAEQHALRDVPRRDVRRDQAQVARDKEHAWLLARLCELLMPAAPRPEPKPARKR